MACDTGAKAQLLRWAAEAGVTSLAEPCTFDGLRGLAATEDVAPGDLVLSVPEALLINEDSVRRSDLGQALAALGQLPEDWLLLCFTMVDRWDPDSAHAPFWASLPGQLSTGLSAPREALEPLRGLPAYQQFTEAREHVRQQYEEMQPLLGALQQAYPAHVKAEHVTHEAYLWAVQLWYAYAMQVEVRPGVLRQSLVPLVSLLNHSAAAPHVREFGRLHPQSRALQLRAAAACGKDQQLFLSYGPLPNWHLLLFYGFAVPQNPADECALSWQDPSEGGARRTVLLRLGAEPRLAAEEAAAALPGGFIEALGSRIRALEAALERCVRDAALRPFSSAARTCLEGELAVCRWHRARSV